MCPFTVGDRALYLKGGEEPKVVTVNSINYNVPAGEEPEISIQLGPGGTIRETEMNRLAIYKTPQFPVGVSSPMTPETMAQMDEMEDYLLYNGPGKSQEEKDILKELNDDSMLTIEAGGERECSLVIMGDNMDSYEELCNQREARHTLIATSPQTWDPETSEDEIDCIISYFNHGRMRKWEAEDDKELDQKNRIITEARITNKGMKHDNAVTKFGKVYIDKKFTRYIPEIGGKVMMVIGMKGCGKTHPWNCYKVL